MERLALYLSLPILKPDFVTSTGGSENKTTTDNLTLLFTSCHRCISVTVEFGSSTVTNFSRAWRFRGDVLGVHLDARQNQAWMSMQE